MNILYLGLNHFPYGLAEVQKSKLLCRGLIDAGCNVTVVIRRGVYTKDSHPEVEAKGTDEGVDYIFTSGSPYKSKSFLVRNLKKTWGWINESILLIKYARKRKLDVVIASTKNMGLLFRYRILSKLLNFKLVLMFMEYNSELSKEKYGRIRNNDLLFEKFAFGMIDGVLPISEFLIEVLNKKAPGLPYMKLPVLCDFDKFRSSNHRTTEKYFLFCGAVNMNIISTILDSFEKVAEIHEDCLLYLVVNGPNYRMEKLHEYIEKMSYQNRIKIFSKLPYPRLVELYLDAIGLLIPMRPILRDIARFPHKIGEYTAAAKPIITTKFGEPANYFVDKESALIADEYNEDNLAEQFMYLLNHPEKAEKIGRKGHEIGLDNFDYRNNGIKTKEFLESL